MSAQSPGGSGVLPVHIGIIMDGNGRWAVARGLPRTNGHQEGLKAAKRVVKAVADRGIGYLSLYTFSTENWNRTPDEVKFLMGLVGKNLRKEYDFYRENRIRVVHSGDIAGLPRSVQTEIERVTKDTSEFDGMVVNLAINYGGRDEIIRAVRRWNTAEEPRQELSIETLREYLDHPTFPDPDLVIRTGGEKRLSNFLLWECAYAEFHFSDTLWPDWTEQDVEAAILEFQLRKRNFGGVR